jgi:anti-anti-sigma regulatory factor
MIVKLPNEMTLNHVAEIRDVLLPALRSREPIELDAQEVTEIDVAGLQLLCSLHRGACNQNTKVTYLGGVRGETIEEAERRAGFARSAGCTPGCLWEEKKRG